MIGQSIIYVLFDSLVRTAITLWPTAAEVVLAHLVHVTALLSAFIAEPRLHFIAGAIEPVALARQAFAAIGAISVCLEVATIIGRPISPFVLAFRSTSAAIASRAIASAVAAL